MPLFSRMLKPSHDKAARFPIHALVMAGCLWAAAATAGTTVFFNSNQVATLVATGVTSDTLSSEGYQFTCTRDKLFTGGVGMTNPIGRTVRVPWPQGVEAQAVTAGPTPGKAQITLKRTDNAPFSLTAFTFKLLANTAGAGATLEIMPVKNGEDAFNDPLYFDANGYYGSQFSYTTAPNYWGSTALLTNYTSYKIGLYVDFAITALTLADLIAPSNQAPTDLTLTGNEVFENDPAGTWVGYLDTADPDAGDTFTYALVPGPGSQDNACFELSGADLLTTTSFNYEVRNSYSIRVQTTDSGGLSTSSVFTVSVLDLDEPPPDATFDAIPGNGQLVLRWAGQPNHRYTIYQSTNLLDGYTAVASNLAAEVDGNSFTNPLPAAPQVFWLISTEP